MRQKLLLFAVSIAFFTSCTNDSSLDTVVNEKSVVSLSLEETKVIDIEENGTLISEDIALQKAISLFSDVVSKSAQPSLLDCRTYWIKRFSNRNMTRSAGNDNDSIPMFLVRYNSGHSVLVSGDRRIPEILAFSENQLTLEKTGTALDIFIERLPVFINKTIDDFESKYDSLLCSVQKKSGYTALQSSSVGLPLSRLEEVVSPWNTVYSYAPLLNVEWGQGYPYNQALDKILCSGTWQFPPVGCVAVAVAQILSFHKYPAVLDGNNFNWIEMTKASSANSLALTYQNQIANLMKSVAEGVDMDFGCNGSGTSISKAKAFLSKIGYNSDNISEYNKNNVISSIQNSRPFYMEGSGSEGRHGWVIDGAKKQERYITQYIYEYKGSNPKPADPIDPAEWALKSENTTHQEDEYVHCNYGYEGMYDGYYHHKVFNLQDNSYFGTIYGPSFNSELLILTNIRRK